MTRTQLEAIHEALTELIDCWNAAAEDGDRGRAQDALCLTLYDDGSGSLGRRSPHTDQVEDWHTFNDAECLWRLLTEEWGLEGEDDVQRVPEPQA